MNEQNLFRLLLIVAFFILFSDVIRREIVQCPVSNTTLLHIDKNRAPVIYSAPGRNGPRDDADKTAKSKGKRDKKGTQSQNKKLPSIIPIEVPEKLKKVFDANSEYLFNVERTQMAQLSMAQIQKRRLNNLKRFCGSTEYKSMQKRRHKEDPVITLIEDYGVIECRVAKTGTTTRGSILWPLFHNEPYKKSHPTFDEAVPKTTVSEFIRGKNFRKKYPFRYLFTRDPFERALSGYFDKVLHLGWLEGKNMTLEQYFKTIALSSTNNHFRNQLSICDPCLLNINFVGRTESLMADMDILVNQATSLHKALNFTKNKLDPSFAQNKSRYDKSRFRELSINRVFDFIWAYRYDYLAYGYDPYETIRQFLNLKQRD